MRYPKLRELKEAIRALIKGPYTSKFPREPHTPYERFRGRPYFHKENCIGCAACIQVCPSGALEFKDTVLNGKGLRKLIVHWDVCIFCGNCQLHCPTEKGITLSQEFDFSVTENRASLKDEIERELILCSCCGEQVLPYEQYLWVAKRIGPLLFSNASLMLSYLEILGLAQKEFSPKQDDQELIRPDRIRVLCPKCRRQAAIKS